MASGPAETLDDRERDEPQMSCQTGVAEANANVRADGPDRTASADYADGAAAVGVEVRT
jgi:hypothetical protein